MEIPAFMERMAAGAGTAGQPPPSDFRSDFSEAVGVQRGLKSGMNLQDAMVQGFQTRKTLSDPLFEMRKQQVVLGIQTQAARLADAYRVAKVHEKQLNDEQNDKQFLTNLTMENGNDIEKLYNKSVSWSPMTPWGMQQKRALETAHLHKVNEDAKRFAQSQASVFIKSQTKMVSELSEAGVDVSEWTTPDENGNLPISDPKNYGPITALYGAHADKIRSVKATQGVPPQVVKLNEEAKKAELVGNLEDARLYRTAAERLASGAKGTTKDYALANEQRLNKEKRDALRKQIVELSKSHRDEDKKMAIRLQTQVNTLEAESRKLAEQQNQSIQSPGMSIAPTNAPTSEGWNKTGDYQWRVVK